MRIAITPGEPAGIGPDLLLSLAANNQHQELIAVANPDLLQQRAQLLGYDINIIPFDTNNPAEPNPANQISVISVPLKRTARPGILDPDNADYVLETLRITIDGCLQGHFDAMVTGPVQKSVINDAGYAFSGHTEFIAERTGGYPVMMLAAENLRVALVTTHLPLVDISKNITTERLRNVIEVLEHDLRERFKIATPRILVCGLNPHAGEGGHLGREEIDTIIPLLESLREQGMDLIGPLPADTLFTPRHLANADAVLAMYHDQGLPVLKYAGFGEAVNITLGLPIIRTSVDHGTALDLAGTGKAETGSLLAAIDMARTLIP